MGANLTDRIKAVENELQKFEGNALIRTDDARDALYHAMAVAALMTDAVTAEGSLKAGVIEKLEEWIKRLADRLTKIVKAIADGTSFSISVGIGVTVTVNFPPYKA